MGYCLLLILITVLSDLLLDTILANLCNNIYFCYSLNSHKEAGIELIQAPNSKGRALKIKIKTPGIYLVNSTLWIYNGDGNFSLKKNSMKISSTPNIGAQNQHSTSLTWIGELNVNDIVEMEITNSVAFSPTDLSFSIFRI